MPGFDAVHLARAQFAFTVSIHIIFPALTIGLASYLMVLEGLYLRTRQSVYMDLFQYWVKIFSLIFGMGVVSGLVMSYQFGTNWAVFSDKAGPIIGPLMGYEVLSAFFLEAGFLGVMLFGLKRVGPKLHFLATCTVAFGTLFSAFWILSVNSWMQTPSGYHLSADGRFLPASWLRIIFNPSFPVRLPHMVLASYLSVAFVVGGAGAWQLLRNNANPASRKMFSMALWMAVLVAPLQIIVGDTHGLNTLQYQPAKIAAIEGLFDTEKGAPLALFGIPNMQTAHLDDAITIPHGASLFLTHSWNGEVHGLKDWPEADRPDALIVFWSFRIMVGLGFAMLGLGLAGAWLRSRHRLYDSKLMLWGSVLMGPSGLVALLAGWVTTEIGRQPYTVFGLLRTTDSVSPIAAAGVATSLAAFAIVYFTVFGTGTLFALRMMAKAPQPGEAGPDPHKPAHSTGIVPGPVLAVGD
jgi:cytochrome d ubiquinol oxidase subunit I